MSLPFRTPRLAAAALSAALALLAVESSGAQQPGPAPAPLAGVAGPVGSPIPGPSLGDTAITIPIPTVPASFGGPAAATFAHTPGLTWDLDVLPYEGHQRVQRYVTLFSTGARDRFTEYLHRGTRYDSLIRGKLRAGGLPEDLTYLALVESGYDVHATSRVRAVGMWQFMAETARDVGLRVDWWVDERRDPVRSTDAAVRTLRWLKGQFGSYFVAAAAYNGGSGRVSRGLAQLADVDSAGAAAPGEARFFALAEHDVLHDETKNYVPQLIAAALVAKEAPRYAIRPAPLPPLAYDSVRVPGLTPLAAVAAASRASRADLLDLNPHLLRGVTPPGAALLVRVPAGQGAAAAERFSKLGDEIRRAFHASVTRKRETWAALAERLGTPRTWLERYNAGLATVAHGRNRGRLVSGQTVRVPTDAVIAYSQDVASDGGGPGALPRLAAAAEAAPGDAAPADEPAAKSERRRGPRADVRATAAVRGQHTAHAKARITVAKLHRRRGAGANREG